MTLVINFEHTGCEHFSSAQNMKSFGIAAECLQLLNENKLSVRGWSKSGKVPNTDQQLRRDRRPLALDHVRVEIWHGAIFGPPM